MNDATTDTPPCPTSGGARRGRHRITGRRPGRTGLWAAILAAWAAVTGPVVAAGTPAPTIPMAETAAGWLPGGQLFAPLAADRRWPRFELGVERYQNDPNLTHANAVSLGGSVALWRSPSADLEAGFQGGAFAVFDRDAPSRDLLNTDYQGAFYVSGRPRPDDAWMVRLLHISTHLGDEFLEANPGVVRENLSFERLDGFVSRTFNPAGPLPVRAYAGAGTVLGPPDPRDWGRFHGQWGLELRHPLRDGAPGSPPVWFLAADVQHEEGRDLAPDLSVNLGLEVPSRRTGGAFQVSLSYYNGRNPNGQFWRDGVQIMGAGVKILF